MIKLERGDIFCTANPMALGRAINFVQKVNSRDNDSDYSHAGIILDSEGTTFEALWTNKKQNLFEAYAGATVLIGRNANMTDSAFKNGWDAVKGYEGKPYAIHRVPLFLIPPLAKYINFGFGVCSEITARFMCGAGLLNYWKGWSPDDIADIIHHWREYGVIHERPLPSG